MKWSRAEGLADSDQPGKRQYYVWRKTMCQVCLDGRIEKILTEVGLEVKRAKQMWGEEFDQKNTQNDWNTYVNIHLSNAAKMGATAAEIEGGLRKAAGLLITAIDVFKQQGFAPRHYEGQTRPKSLPEVK
jgi:hypothetical protein